MCGTHIKQMHHTHTLIHTKYLPQNDPLYNQQCLSFIIYTCRNILGGMVTDILVHLRHTAFVVACSQLGTYITHTCNYSQLYLYYVLHFFISGQCRRLSRKPQYRCMTCRVQPTAIARVLKQLQSIANQIISYVANIVIKQLLLLYIKLI